MDWNKLEHIPRVLLTICNIILSLAIIFSLYNALSRVLEGQAAAIALIFPFICLSIFLANLYTFWKYLGHIVSVLLIFGNLILIPAFQLIFVFAIPLAMGIAKQLNPEADVMEIIEVTVFGRIISLALLSNCVYLAFLMYNNKKAKAEK